LAEYLDIVDERDTVIGRRPRRECFDKSLLHRAIVVFLTNPQGEVYLQKRSRDVFFYPGHWCASVAGHVSSGETYLQAAKREIKEELGINCKLTERGKFMTPKWKIDDKREWEFITVFEGHSTSEIALRDEAEEGRDISQREFERLVESKPEICTPDTLLALKYYRATKSSSGS